MGNSNPKKGMIIDVQPLKSKKQISDMIESLGMNRNGLRDQLLFKIGISTGLRIGDLVSLKVSDVRGKSKLILSEEKTGKSRTVYLNHVMADIADYLETLPEGAEYLFQNERGNSHITKTQAYRLLVKAGEMIGFNSIGTHTLRKTFGYLYYQETKDLPTLMTIFRHSSQAMTLRYIGITEKTIEDSIKSVKFY